MTSQEMQASWDDAAVRPATDSSKQFVEPTLVHRRPDPLLDTYLRRIDPRIAKSFTAEQRQAIRTMFDGRTARRHGLDFRQSIGFGRHRFYLVVLGGRERRLLPKSSHHGAFAHLAGWFGYLALTGALLGALAFFVYTVKG